MSATQTASTAVASLNQNVKEVISQVSPEMKANFEQLERLWNHPVTRFGVELTKDQAFTGALESIRESHATTQLMAFEGILIGILWAFRAWRLGKVNTLLMRMWTQAWVAALFWVLAVFLVPFLVWGGPYGTLLSHLVRAFIKHILA